MSSLEQRLAQLEQQVAALQEAAQGEQLSPNYLTISPSGLVTALFTGGVQMDEAPSTGYESPNNGLGWLDSAGAGVLRELIYGWYNGSDHQLAAQSQADSTDQAALTLYTKLTGPAGSAGVGAECFDDSGAASSVTFIDSLQRSSFLQLLSIEKIRLAFGSELMAFNGEIGQNIGIAHGLGAVPQAAGVFAVDGSEFLTVQQSAVADDHTLYVSASVAVTRTVNWIAIG